MSESRQCAFMKHLIDIVVIADTAEDPKNKLFREPGVVRWVKKKVTEKINAGLFALNC